MLCERCGKRPAAVCVAKEPGGVRSERWLCFRCAEEEVGPEFCSTVALLEEILDQDLRALLSGKKSIHRDVGEKQIRCSRCGTSYAEFAETGMLGCASCYEEFEGRLDPLILRIHGSLNHLGKVPSRAGRRVLVEREIERLRRELRRCLAKEEYEEASKIDERIKELESASAT